MTRNSSHLTDRNLHLRGLRRDFERLSARDERELSASEALDSALLKRTRETDTPNSVQHNTPYALSARHRFILSRLVANGGETSLTALAFDITTQLSDGEESDVEPPELRRTYLDLHRTILEELATRGVVEYCENDGAVRATL